MMATTGFLSVVLLLCLAYRSECLTVKLLPPTKNGTFDVGIIIAPGADIKGEAYMSLGLAIQKTFPGRMWIALLCDFIFNTPNPVQFGEGVDEAISKFKSDGFQGSYIFLAGHSLGGVFTANYGLQHASKFSGVLLFAAYLTRSHRLRDYPVPLMTISGDLDGLTRITRIVDTFDLFSLKAPNCITEYNYRELENETIHNPNPMNLMYIKPVIVLPGINHGHFASGEMPPNVVKHDLPVDSDVTYQSAHEDITNFVTCFINVITRLPPEDFLTAIAYMKVVGFYRTQQLMTPLKRIKLMDVNQKRQSETTELVQEYLLGQKLAQYVKVNDTEVQLTEIETFEPEVKVEGSTAHVRTFSSVIMPFNPEDLSLNPQTPKEIQSVMKSKDGIRKLLPDVPYDVGNLTCRDANQLLFNYAYNESSEVARNRTIERKSPAIAFNDDIISGSLVEWTITPFKLEYGSNGELTVSSPAYITSADDSGTASGVRRCKLLSPYRAMEWIYVDSLKRNRGSH